MRKKSSAKNVGMIGPEDVLAERGKKTGLDLGRAAIKAVLRREWIPGSMVVIDMTNTDENGAISSGSPAFPHDAAMELASELRHAGWHVVVHPYHDETGPYLYMNRPGDCIPMPEWPEWLDMVEKRKREEALLPKAYVDVEATEDRKRAADAAYSRAMKMAFDAAVSGDVAAKKEAEHATAMALKDRRLAEKTVYRYE